MKKMIVLLLLMLIGCKEQQVNFTDLEQLEDVKFKLPGVENLYTGKAYSYYDNGNKKEIYRFLDGELSSLTTWYNNGQLESKGEFIYPVWPEDGLGTKDGMWYYWYRNGILQAVEHYNEGHVVGMATSWDSTGVIMQSTLHIGKAGRIHIEYYDNLHVKSMQEYERVKLNGAFRCWYRNGNLKEVAFYEDGLLEGERKIWSEEEQLLKLEKYSKGRLLYKKEYQ